MKAIDPPIIVTELLNHSVEEVWVAITEVKQMRQWFFEDIPAFEPRVGFSTVFDVQAPSMVFPHHWTILEVEDGKKIVYDWHYGDACVGKGVVIFELSVEGPATRITLINKVLEDFPQDLPEFKRESGECGWNYFIKDRLRNYLSGGKSN